MAASTSTRDSEAEQRSETLVRDQGELRIAKCGKNGRKMYVF